MDVKYTNIFQSKTLQNLHKLGFLVLNYAIWQPWSTYVCRLKKGPFFQSKFEKRNLQIFREQSKKTQARQMLAIAMCSPPLSSLSSLPLSLSHFLSQSLSLPLPLPISLSPPLSLLLPLSPPLSLFLLLLLLSLLSLSLSVN
jgi:hypothetical protein